VEEAKSNIRLVGLMLRLEAKERGLRQLVFRFSMFCTVIYEYQSSFIWHY
jgi:hypothetical protein